MSRYIYFFLAVMPVLLNQRSSMLFVSLGDLTCADPGKTITSCSAGGQKDLALLSYSKNCMV